MILPGLETEAEWRELGKALAEFRVTHQMRRDDAGGEFLNRVVLVPGHTVSDAAKAPAGDGDLGLQNLTHLRAERQVSVADDRLGDTARAITGRGAHRSDAVDEFDLADRRHLCGAVLAVHRAAFEKYGRDDIM